MPVTSAVPTARRPGLSIRMQLTLSYAGFVTFAGLVLSGVLLVVLHYVPDDHLMVVDGGFAPGRSDLLREAWRLCAFGIALLALVGLVGGWFLAGRMLSPLRRISQAAAAAGAGSLRHRIELPGRDDELRRLADTFDHMLERLQNAFDEQRRFTANASHELRTPHTVVKTMLEVARANPEGRNVETLLARLQEMNDRSITTLEALLLLARLDQAEIRLQVCDLAEVVRAELKDAGSPVRWETSLHPARVDAEPALLARMVSNLLRNAAVHNLPSDGWASVEVGEEDGRPFLAVTNPGPVLTPRVAATLAEPFVRGRERVRSGQGSGLGLTLVASVARAHRARLTLRPRPEGGLRAVIRFPG